MINPMSIMNSTFVYVKLYDELYIYFHNFSSIFVKFYIISKI